MTSLVWARPDASVAAAAPAARSRYRHLVRHARAGFPGRRWLSAGGRDAAGDWAGRADARLRLRCWGRRLRRRSIEEHRRGSAGYDRSLAEDTLWPRRPPIGGQRIVAFGSQPVLAAAPQPAASSQRRQREIDPRESVDRFELSPDIASWAWRGRCRSAAGGVSSSSLTAAKTSARPSTRRPRRPRRASHRCRRDPRRQRRRTCGSTASPHRRRPGKANRSRCWPASSRVIADQARLSFSSMATSGRRRDQSAGRSQLAGLYGRQPAAGIPRARRASQW